MLWSIAAPFLTSADARWIDDFVIEGDNRFRKISVPAASSWHDRATRATPLAGWLGYWRQASRALREGEGVVTVFPQLALATALRRRLTGGHQPVVAWTFNLGAYPTGLRGRLAAAILREIDHFVVHSRAETRMLRDWLDLPEDRISFVPLQRAPIPRLAEEDGETPFAVAMGSANRDYPTLIEAARITGIPLTIVAAPRIFAGVALPANVRLLSGLTPEDCWQLAQRARISIVPLAATEEASGQITVVEALRMGRPLIATRSSGTVDYVEHGVNGLLVPGGEAAALAVAWQQLWHDSDMRTKLGMAAAAYAESALSDEKAGAALKAILDNQNLKRTSRP